MKVIYVYSGEGKRMTQKTVGNRAEGFLIMSNAAVLIKTGCRFFSRLSDNRYDDYSLHRRASDVMYCYGTHKHLDDLVAPMTGKTIMVFERNLNGIDVILRIDDYESPFKHSFGEWWCDCGFSFRMGKLAEIINYRKDHDELFAPEEVDGLADALTNLLDGKTNEPQEYPMVEPDFVFMLYPIKDLRTDPKYSYVAPGYEFQDIYVEWRVFFWDGGITENYLTLTMYRDDIIAFRDFLESVRGSKNEW